MPSQSSSSDSNTEPTASSFSRTSSDQGDSSVPLDPSSPGFRAALHAAANQADDRLTQIVEQICLRLHSQIGRQRLIDTVMDHVGIPIELTKDGQIALNTTDPQVIAGQYRAFHQGLICALDDLVTDIINGRIRSSAPEESRILPRSARPGGR